jgi:hypothetical protein
MSKKRMRYQWFQDVPRNVTRQEYRGLHWRYFCSGFLGLFAAGALVSAFTGVMMQTSRDLAKVNAMSVADAIDAEGDRHDMVKLEGFIVADDALPMPDDEAQRVIRGTLTLLARNGSSSDDDSDNGDDEPLIRETLFDWNNSASEVFLTDGDRRIPLAFDLAVLPMDDAPHDEFSPKVIKQGDSVRNQQPVAVEYGEMLFPLDPTTWGEADSVFTDIERQLLPEGQSVVIVASIDTGVPGNQLVDPLGDRLQVLIGTEESIRADSIRTRIMFVVVAIPLGIVSWIIWRSAQDLQAEFVERSNQ